MTPTQIQLHEQYIRMTTIMLQFSRIYAPENVQKYEKELQWLKMVLAKEQVAHHSNSVVLG